MIVCLLLSDDVCFDAVVIDLLRYKSVLTGVRRRGQSTCWESSVSALDQTKSHRNVTRAIERGSCLVLAGLLSWLANVTLNYANHCQTKRSRKIKTLDDGRK